VNPLISRLKQRKHLVLLVGLVLMSALQPISQGIVGGLIIYDVVLTLVLLGVFVIVFEQGIERKCSLLIAIPAVGSRWVAYGLKGESLQVAVVIHHLLLLIFFGFAVAVILRGIFHERVITSDHVIGTVCGYLLAGAAWGNAYVLAELLLPGSFNVNQEIAWQLENPHSRSFLFNYLSLSTLTSCAYGDITPVGPGVATLTWTEGVFGQFYIAVVVAQLVGLRLAQAIEGQRPGGG
jgi:voltage-gated potassium channel